ncbi:Protein glass [Gryllus bimaculatus]|nr:Protein glass [Gryllus bimaculatus]
MDVTPFLEVSLKTEDGEVGGEARSFTPGLCEVQIKEEPEEPVPGFCEVLIKEEPLDENGDEYMEEDEEEEGVAGKTEDDRSTHDKNERVLQILADAVEEEKRNKASRGKAIRGSWRSSEKCVEAAASDVVPIDLSKKEVTVAGKRKAGSEEGAGGRTPKKHPCAQCGKAFATPSHLRTHVRTHSGTKPFRCPDCAAAFAQSNNLRRHLRTHTRERPYKCAQCDCAFRDSSHLQRHRLLHTGERPFRCDECGTAFAQSNTLRDHVRLHTGERPFPCALCPEAFVRRSHLNAHHLRAHAHDGAPS